MGRNAPSCTLVVVMFECFRKVEGKLSVTEPRAYDVGLRISVNLRIFSILSEAVFWMFTS